MEADGKDMVESGARERILEDSTTGESSLSENVMSESDARENNTMSSTGESNTAESVVSECSTGECNEDNTSHNPSNNTDIAGKKPNIFSGEGTSKVKRQCGFLNTKTEITGNQVNTTSNSNLNNSPLRIPLKLFNFSDNDWNQMGNCLAFSKDSHIFIVSEILQVPWLSFPSNTVKMNKEGGSVFFECKTRKSGENNELATVKYKAEFIDEKNADNFVAINNY